MPKIRVLADQHVYRLTPLITTEHHLDTFNPDEGLPHNVGSYDALVLRTVTPINHQTLPEKGRLNLIASASVGLDHIDQSYLESMGIKVISAAGCNARAVAEYVVTMFLYAALRHKWDIQNLRVGIVGVGHTGGAVHALLETLGVQCRLYDPPRALRDPQFTSCTREQVLDTDVLTLHLPLINEGLINEGLITEGALATYHWLDRTALAQGPHKLLIQASRGGVVDEQALLEVLNHSDSRLAVIDVWEGEPEVNKRLLEKAFVATPHIAGYSQQAKIMATVSIMLQLNRFFGISTTPVEQLRKQWMQGLVPTAPLQPLSKNAAYPVPEPLMQDYLVYDRKLRQGILDPDPTQAADPAAYFRYLRTSIPFRFEYASWKPYMESIDFREAWPFWAHLAV